MATNFGFLVINGGAGVALTEVTEPITGELTALHDAAFVFQEYIGSVADSAGLPTNFIDLLPPSTVFAQSVQTAFAAKGLTGRVIADKTLVGAVGAVWAERPLDGLTPIPADEFRLLYVMALIEACRELGVALTVDFEIQPTP